MVEKARRKKRMNTKDILRKYGRKIEEQMKTQKVEKGTYSREYQMFKAEMAPELSRYERLCKSLGNIIKLKVAEKDKKKTQKHLDIAHLDVTPSQVITLSVVTLLLTFVVGILISVAIFIIQGATLEVFPFLFFFLVVIIGLFLFYYTYTTPARLANSWRLKASSQMVPCILYVVAYMKHTSNLERAIAFAATHLQPPLSLDFKKVFWDIETGKYSTIKDSLDAYLETWRDYSIEFIESFHLIESSLYEPSEARRITVLEKSLQVILDGVYEKTLKYVREIRSPIQNVYMLGVVLPILGIALIPLASTLLGGIIKWSHVIILYNFIIPFIAFFLMNKYLLMRPGGYGEAELLELNPLYPKYKSKKPYVIAFLICLPLLILGFSPFIFKMMDMDYTFNEFGIGFLGDIKFFDFMDGTGPFGIIALLLSLFIPLSIALFFIISYKMKTRELIKEREKSKQLEREFTSSLFQLGNRLADGTPAEIAFAKVAESSRGLATENFFKTINTNIRQMGMSVEQAIFHPRRGAIVYYPSALISTSMRILVESVKKGLRVAAKSLMSISQYAKNIHKINERLRDLLAEIVSDMKSNATFLAPLLAGIVVALSGMITLILSKLEVMFETQGDFAIAGFGSAANILDIFKLESMIPPFFLQIAVGIYIIEIIFILTKTLVVIDSGEDKLKVRSEISKNLRMGFLLYLISAFIAILALALLAAFALGGIG